jgi:hypothetical protein
MSCDNWKRCFDEAMTVMVHQAINMVPPAVAIHHLREAREERGAVTIVPDDILAGIVSARTLVDGTEVYDAERTGHDGEPSGHTV